VDHDGVLNVPSLGRPDEAFERVFDAGGFRHRVPAGTSGRIARLEAAFEPVWATTWEEMAPLLLAPHLGFGRGWPVVRFDVGSLKAITWKLAAVKRWCEANAEGRRLGWIDDDLGPDAEAWAAARGGTLLVRTYETDGLTDAEVEQLLDWAAG
jgi:hypothetical protein